MCPRRAGPCLLCLFRSIDNYNSIGLVCYVLLCVYCISCLLIICLQKDLRTGSISRDIVNFPSELCRRRSGVFTEVSLLVLPDKTFHFRGHRILKFDRSKGVPPEKVYRIENNKNKQAYNIYIYIYIYTDTKETVTQEVRDKETQQLNKGVPHREERGQ